jgi:2-(1,2-epoxy-1,2-dihydrophenyl)acetyl-CoA isomerase
MTDVVIEVDGPVGVVRLNRPERGNAVTPAVVTQLGEAVTELGEAESVRAIVLTGTGEVFCAGADVREMSAIFVEAGPDGFLDYHVDVWWPSVQSAVRALWYVPKPLVAAFNGAATAGGLDFGLACDARVASPTARFAESYVNLGMVPVAGGAFLLPLVVGLPAAMDLLASGQLIDAERALAIGLVQEICAPEELESRAAEIALRLAHGTAETFRLTKRIARRAATEELERVLRESFEANVGLLKLEEVRSSVVAVMEKYAARAAG